MKRGLGVAMIGFQRSVTVFLSGCLILFQEFHQAQSKCTELTRKKCYFVCKGIRSRSDVNIDLSAIDSQGSARFTDIPDADHDQEREYVYSYNPCTRFSDPDHCKSVNVCQREKLHDVYIDIGSTVHMLYDSRKKAFFLEYKGDGERVTQVQLAYKRGVEGKIYEVTERETNHYYMILYTKYAPDVDSGDSGDSGGGGISTGTVLLIIFFVVLVLYLGIGMAFLRYRRGAVGKDMIPQYEFWSKIPGLAKDGCIFSAKKSKECFSTVTEKTTGKNEQGEYEKI